MRVLLLVDQSHQMFCFKEDIKAVTERALSLGGKVIPVTPRKDGTWSYYPDGQASELKPLNEHPDMMAGGPARLILITDGMSDVMLGKSLVSYLSMMDPGTLLFILHPWPKNGQSRRSVEPQQEPDEADLFRNEWVRSRLGKLFPGCTASRSRRKRPGAVVPVMELNVENLEAACRRKTARGVNYSVTLNEDDRELDGVLSRRNESVRAAHSDANKAERLVRLGIEFLPSATMKMLACAAFAGEPVTIALIRHLGLELDCGQGFVEPYELSLAITSGLLTWASPDEAKRGEDALMKLVVPEIVDAFRKRISDSQVEERVLEAVSMWRNQEDYLRTSSCTA